MSTTEKLLMWNKCHPDIWCPLGAVDVEHSHFNSMEGVYIVWHGGSDAATVFVGQGVIREQIKACRVDPRIQAYAAKGLYVTWASVIPAERNGIAAALCDQLKPALGGVSPEIPRIRVNLPW